ncbi:MAG: chorismate-binding protein [Acidimicrobiales bacterium]
MTDKPLLWAGQSYPVPISPWQLLRNAEEARLPVRAIRASSGWLVGIGEALHIDYDPLSDDSRDERKRIANGLKDHIDSTLPLWFFQSPFDPSEPYRHVVPELIVTFETDRDATATSLIMDNQVLAERYLPILSDTTLPISPAGGAPLVEGVMLPSPDRFIAQVEEILAHIKDAELTKVVLSATAQARTAPLFTVTEALSRLAASHHNSHAFLYPDFFGVSPELIVSHFSGVIRSQPLAGTRSAERREELFASIKDNHEHRVVVEEIVRDLTPLSDGIDVGEARRFDIGDLSHLRTDIVARSRGGVRLVDLATALAPTPAVGGVPKLEALSTIARLENGSRGYYGGLTGYETVGGDGEAYLTIRGVAQDGVRLTFQAGVGVVDGSEPEEEFSEATAKLGSIITPLCGDH